MGTIPEDELEETRAALAPTLHATAAILPWVAQAKTARFASELNDRWLATCRQLRADWSERQRLGTSALRPTIFALYGIALETQDADCLALGEAFASCADHFESTAPSPRVVAALSAALECFDDPAGLEHEAFGERAQHFAGRIADSLRAPPDLRSPLIDRLFVDEALEQIDSMREALAALPVDAYALASEAVHLAQQAEQTELWGVMHLARQLGEQIRLAADRLDDPAIHAGLDETVARLATLISAIDT